MLWNGGRFALEGVGSTVTRQELSYCAAVAKITSLMQFLDSMVATRTRNVANLVMRVGCAVSAF